MRCLECDCWLIRDYKCPHDCEWCKDYDPEEETEQEDRQFEGILVQSIHKMLESK